MSAKSNDKVTIKIPRILYDRLAKIVDDSGFNSVTDFVVYVLRDLASTKSQSLDDGTLSKQEIDVIRKRLESLGYF